MIDLSLIAGIPIFFDEERNSLVIDEPAKCENERVHLNQLIYSLLNRYIKYPEIVYTQHKIVGQKEDEDTLVYDVVTVPYGLLGIEYIRTHVFGCDESCGRADCIVQMLKGSLTVMLQKNIKSDDPYAFEKSVESVTFVEIKEGDKLVIPTGYVYTFINTSNNETAIFAKINSQSHTSIDYSKISKEKGLAYYIISKNARIETVPNPKYKLQNEAEQKSASGFAEQVQANLRKFFQLDTPLYEVYQTKKKELKEIIK